jgi:hypothetical protein
MDILPGLSPSHQECPPKRVKPSQGAVPGVRANGAPVWYAMGRLEHTGSPRNVARWCRGAAPSLAVMTVWIGLAIGFTLGSVRLDVISAADASNVVTELPRSIQLAQAFTAALNGHDVDALVELFTEEDAGPTVTADRFAWQKFEIRLWAQQQVQAGIRSEAYDFRVTEHGAAWKADVYRDDWRALGAEFVPVTNTIWVHNGQLADFTSNLSDPRDMQRLGPLWQPGAVPDRPTTTLVTQARSAQRWEH